jgi:hypothetical protein
MQWLRQDIGSSSALRTGLSQWDRVKALQNRVRTPTTSTARGRGYSLNPLSLATRLPSRPQEGPAAHAHYIAGHAGGARG